MDQDIERTYEALGRTGTASQLSEWGVEKMRLPNWNEHAYLEVSRDGPWALLYDVLAGIGGGQPIPMLLVEADKHNNWEPVKP